MVDWTSFLPILNGIIVGLSVPLLIYLIKSILNVNRLLKRHEKILFGDDDIKAWEGIVEITLANRKYTINDRRALIELINMLTKNKIIEIDEDYKKTLDILKTGE